MRIVNSYNQASTQANAVPARQVHRVPHETRLWKKCTSQSLFIEEAHRKETIRCYTKILKADKEVTKVTQDNRKMFTKHPTDIYKTQLQFEREHAYLMQQAKQTRKVLREQKKKERELRKQQQLLTNNSTEEDEAIVNP
jgi:hypothetical protein